MLNKDQYSYNDFSEIVGGYLTTKIPERDMENWIKLIFERGMTTQESADYTKAIIDTGIKITFPTIDAPVVDKHSTGGVGDKVSLILGPLLAAYGYHVPMIVGTSLGHTGGTLDKLCSIPGYQPYLTIEKFKKNVEDIGLSIMGQTEQLCPGDRKIYELRDRMNMIDSYPLICGSIMGKKIAEGIDTLALDIKTGNGAFMHTLEMARELGSLLKKIGELNDVNVNVVITDMSQPLGELSGVGCEVAESIEALKGRGPDDLMELVYHLAREIIGVHEDNFNSDTLKNLIENGSAYEKFIQMTEAHGGSITEFNRHYKTGKFKHIINAESDGYVKSFETKRIGELLSHIGAGRLDNSDGIDNFSGVRVLKKISDAVSKDEPVLEFCCSSEQKINNLRELSEQLFEISESSCRKQQLIYK